ncbi:hypothetical protein HPP92_028355 [Vanilla planifolia]|uniref:O-fucosyltransferase family protein n=1 Tax=Vanilla planifolia TaxID=51239 RepID=A0A835P6B2_VANPL|nr:hypothetical protein HPP92_028355 [Vanilla planifolia]
MAAWSPSSWWRKRSFWSKHYIVLLSLSFLFVLLFIVSSADRLKSFLLLKAPSRPGYEEIQCGPLTSSGAESLSGERFLWYAPHSGFSNQLSELRNAILFAAILNRTLIIPPVLDHHAVALGSCPKFRVTSPSDLRAAVWDHTMDLVRDRRYISMADIVDLSRVASTRIKTIDFRVFASMWCGLNIDGTCWGSRCCAVSAFGSSIHKDPSHCRSLLSGLHGNVNGCIHSVEEDCRTTVWTYQEGNDGTLDRFQPNEQLQKRKKVSYTRNYRDLHKAFGPGSAAYKSKVLSFGSLFTSPYKGSELYINIHEAPNDPQIQSLIKDIEFLPLAPEIVSAGKEIAQNVIKDPFLCAQLRLLDGQFKNHWKITFSELQQKLLALQSKRKENKDSRPIHVFIMTDLPYHNWTGTYLKVLVKDTKSYKLHTLNEKDELVVEAAKRVMAAEHSLKMGFLPGNVNSANNVKVCSPATLPDILLYIEEAVCSCASVGFVGTVGSTIAESILLMRKNSMCKM